MAVNKVEYGGQTLVDLTADTVTKETLIAGATAHNAAGESIEGVVDLTNYATLQANDFSGTQTVHLDTNVTDASAFMKANVVATVNSATAGGNTRAAYGFHNGGICGIALYLDADRTLKTIDDLGNKMLVPFSSNINQIKWNLEKYRPEFLMIDGSWVDIPSYNDVANVIQQSPKTLADPFFIASADTYADSSSYRYLIYNSGGNNFAGIGVDTSGNIVFKTGINATNIFTMFNNGHLMINNGNLFTGNITVGGASVISTTELNLISAANTNIVCQCGTAFYVMNIGGSAWAPVYASAFTQQSSKKYKKNIEDISKEEASKILELRPVKYNYINENNGVGCYGLIAEEVDEVMSYPVVYDADGNPDGIDYSKFVPHLIKMVQLQQSEIDELKKSNEELKIRLEKLEKLLNADKEVG